MEKLNLIIMTNLELVLIIILAIITGFCFGLVTGLNASDYADDNADDNIHEDLYCFQCEIEMPVKEKNGRLYCTNCKLRHGRI
jgi:hypothetical protein